MYKGAPIDLSAIGVPHVSRGSNSLNQTRKFDFGQIRKTVENSSEDFDEDDRPDSECRSHSLDRLSMSNENAPNVSSATKELLCAN
jgi:hypothetical protein